MDNRLDVFETESYVPERKTILHVKFIESPETSQMCCRNSTKYSKNIIFIQRKNIRIIRFNKIIIYSTKLSLGNWNGGAKLLYFSSCLLPFEI